MPNSVFVRLIDLAEQQLEQQQTNMLRANQEHQQAQQQLGALQQYREDYAQRLLQTSQSGMSMANYHNFHRFIGTLDQAISQQNRVIQQISQQVAKQQQRWLAAKQRLNAYETLQKRRDVAAAEQLLRQEQRQNDELSSAMFYRAHHAN